MQTTAQVNKISKTDLPPGRHLLKDGFIFIDVTNRDELDHIEIYQDPAEIAKLKRED